MLHHVRCKRQCYIIELVFPQKKTVLSISTSSARTYWFHLHFWGKIGEKTPINQPNKQNVSPYQNRRFRFFIVKSLFVLNTIFIQYYHINDKVNITFLKSQNQNETLWLYPNRMFQPTYDKFCWIFYFIRYFKNIYHSDSE